MHPLFTDGSTSNLVIAIISSYKGYLWEMTILVVAGLHVVHFPVNQFIIAKMTNTQEGRWHGEETEVRSILMYCRGRSMLLNCPVMVVHSRTLVAFLILRDRFDLSCRGTRRKTPATSLINVRYKYCRSIEEKASRARLTLGSRVSMSGKSKICLYLARCL